MKPDRLTEEEIRRIQRQEGTSELIGALPEMSHSERGLLLHVAMHPGSLVDAVSASTGVAIERIEELAAFRQPEAGWIRIDEEPYAKPRRHLSPEPKLIDAIRTALN